MKGKMNKAVRTEKPAEWDITRNMVTIPLDEKIFRKYFKAIQKGKTVNWSLELEVKGD